MFSSFPILHLHINIKKGLPLNENIFLNSKAYIKCFPINLLYPYTSIPK